jgi:hypothetical protein
MEVCDDGQTFLKLISYLGVAETVIVGRKMENQEQALKMRVAKKADPDHAVPHAPSSL